MGRGPGKPVTPDGLDRTSPDGIASTMDRYLLALFARNQSPFTADTRRRALISFTRWCERQAISMPIEVTRETVVAYQHHLWCLCRADSKALCIGTQIGRLVAVRGLFRWLFRSGTLPSDPSACVEMPREPRRLPGQTMSEREVRRVLAAPDTRDALGVRDRAILELLYSTALRRTEFTQIQLHDLHLERRTLYVRRGKGGHDRMVPVGQQALRWTQRYLNEARPLLACDEAEQTLFLTGYGHGFSPGSLANVVTGLIRAAGIPQGGCHLFRHACATHMLERGADVRVIQQLLGHAKLETTAIYTRVSIRLLQDVHTRTHPTAR